MKNHDVIVCIICLTGYGLIVEAPDGCGFWQHENLRAGCVILYVIYQQSPGEFNLWFLHLP